MTVLYLLTYLLLPWSAESFFLSSPTAQPLTTLSCYAGEYVKITDVYTTTYNNVWPFNNSAVRLCAIREDTGMYNGSSFLHRTYIANIIPSTLRQMARTRCQGFSVGSDVGYGLCTPRSFELYNSTTLCICATDLCNRDFVTCQQSIASSNPSQSILPQIVPSLTTPIRCYDNTLLTYQYSYPYITTNMSYICMVPVQYSSMITSYVPIKLLNQQACDIYARANSVLCAIDRSTASTYSSYGSVNGYTTWQRPHSIRYTAEEYADSLAVQLFDNAQYNGFYPYYPFYYGLSNNATTIYEGQTNVVVRHDYYDSVGNLLDGSSVTCFCSTDNCNIDFATCASGINYNSTSSTTTSGASLQSSTPTTTAGSSTQGIVTTRATTTPSTGTTTVSVPTLWASSVAFYSFDGNALDLFSTYNGVTVGGATFNSAGYVRQALLLSTSTQYVQTSFINLAYQSFSISAWISTTNIQNGTIFSQCSTRVARKCLTLGLLNRYLFMDFFGGFNSTGTTLLTISQWFHVAFVYDQVLQQQLIYLNGVENGRSALGSTPPYLGTCQAVNIGSFLIGWIDQLSVSNRVKSPSEILIEGTLVAAYSFKGNLLDSGPNGLNGTGTTSFDSGGRIDQALQLTNTSALFQAIGLTVFSIPSQSFSISLWLKPQLIVGGSTILALSSTNWCTQLLGFSTMGALVFKINGVSSSAGNLSTIGWTHVVYTYNTTNGVGLFINGMLVQNLQAVFARGTSPTTMTVGGPPTSNPACTSVLVASGRYQGLVDELKVFSRELTSVDIYNLANP